MHDVPTGGADSPHAHLADQAGLLGDGNEAEGRNHALLGMLPAHQGFDADHRPGFGIDLRLVVEQQLVAFQRPSQVRLQAQPVHALRIHAVVVEQEGILAAGLGLVHRRVRRLEQTLDGVGVAWGDCDTDAGGYHQLVFVDTDGLQQAVEKPLGHLAHGVVVLHLVQHHSKLVAAQARHIDTRLAVDIVGHHVTVAHAAGQPLRHFLQQEVTGAVTQGVVDALEIVQVEEHQGERFVIAPRQAQQQVQLLGEQAAIGQGGQAVEVGQLAQPVAGLGDLPHGAAELLVALAQLRGALLDFHAEQLMIDIDPALVLVQAADDRIQDRGDFLDLPTALHIDRLFQSTGIDGVGLACQLGQGGHQAAGVPGDQQAGTQQ